MYAIRSYYGHFLNSRPTIIKTGLYNSQDDELLIVLMPDKYTKEGFEILAEKELGDIKQLRVHEGYLYFVADYSGKNARNNFV